MRKAREEALQAFAGAEFVKSYSKVEKERSSVNIHDKRKSDNFLESPAVIKINKPSGTPNNLSLSPNISDSSHLKIDESVNLTPFAARSPSPSNNNTSSGNRPEDVTPENKGNKKEISTAETAEKPINNDSGDKLSSLKTNLNSKFKEESFEAMLSTSKKKLPKIAEEKRLAKEREEQRRKEELKQMNSKDMIFKLDTCVLSQKKGSSL